jgi:hypothetical protein
MIAILSLLFVVVLSLLIVRIATVALSLTGMSRELARFQARSAFTGSGFTTKESEQVMMHPIRRRIIMWLMLLGNAGIVTVISSLFLSLTSSDGSGTITDRVWFRILVLLLGLTGLSILTYSKWLDKKISRFIEYLLARYTDIEVRDYAGLLHLTGNYVVGEMTVREDDWLAGRKLMEMRLSEEGILVLGIERTDGTYIGAPRGHNTLEIGDVLLLYGQTEALENLDQRRTGSEGNWEHFKAVERQKKIESEERKLDEQKQEPEEEPAATD